jgi:tetratricopeptide (TPR) repeat protein
MARVHDRLGRPTDAEQAYRQQMAMLKELTAEFPLERKYRFDLYHSYLALIPLLSGRDREAEELAHEGLALIRALVQDFPAEPLFRDALAHQLGRVGQFLAQRGQFEEAARFHRDGLALARALVAEFPDRKEAPSFSRNVTFNLNELAAIHLKLGQLTDAEQLYREVLALAEQQADAFPDEPGHRLDFAARQFNLAELLRETGRLDAAQQFYKRALTIAEKLSHDFPSVPRYLATVAAVQCGLGYLHESAGRRAEAEQAFQLSISIDEGLSRDFPELHQIKLRLSWLLSTCPVETLRAPARAFELAKRAAEQAPQRADYRDALGVALYRAGDFASCVATLQNNTPALNDSSLSSGLFLAMAYWQLGDQAKSREIYQQTIRSLDDLPSLSDERQRFRAEAAELLGL